MSTSTEQKKQKRGHRFDKILETFWIFHFETINNAKFSLPIKNCFICWEGIVKSNLFMVITSHNCHFCTKNKIFYTKGH